MNPAVAVTLVIVIVALQMALIAFIMSQRFKRRELEHKERLVALEKGVPMPLPVASAPTAPWSPHLYFLRGLIWLFTGIALTLFLAGLSITSQHPLTIEERVREANWLKGAGASDAQVLAIENDTTSHSGIVLGLALIGLVPIGVGAAYLIFYYTAAKSMQAPADVRHADHG